MRACFSRRSLRAATLIEVVVAIGVLSIISLGIWAGLSVGLKRTNDFRNLTEMAQIQDYLFSTIEGGSVSITNLPSSAYYFDDEGLAVASGAETWAYNARISLVSSTASVSLPNGSANTNLMSVQIQVQARSGASKTNYCYFVAP